jgi:hypothetical protein
MQGNLDNQKDIDNVSNANSKGNKDYIKFKKGKNFIRLLSKDFVGEFEHNFRIGKRFVSFVCLGGLDKKGYDPDNCPACKIAKEHFWDKRAKLQDNSKFDKSKKLQAEANQLTKEGKELITRQTTKMAAVYGEAVKVKDKASGKIMYEPEWEEEAKIIAISPTQWDKLTKNIFENYSFMESSEDLINRNLIFSKGTGKKGEEVKQNTPIEIKPEKKKSDPPEITNELPDLSKAFNYLTKKEIEKIMREFLSQGIEYEEDEDEEEDDIDEDFEDDEVEEEIEEDEEDEDDLDEDFDDEEEEEEEDDFDDDDFELDEGDEEEEEEEVEEKPKKEVKKKKTTKTSKSSKSSKPTKTNKKPVKSKKKLEESPDIEF